MNTTIEKQPENKENFRENQNQNREEKGNRPEDKHQIEKLIHVSTTFQKMKKKKADLIFRQPSFCLLLHF